MMHPKDNNMTDILDRIADSSPNESSHELICRLRDCAREIEALRTTAKQAPAVEAVAGEQLSEEVKDLLDRIEDLRLASKDEGHDTEDSMVLSDAINCIMRLANPQPASEQQRTIDRTPPFATCRYRECDLPGQCRTEGKCHHPASEQQAAPLTPEQVRSAREYLRYLTTINITDAAMGAVLERAGLPVEPQAARGLSTAQIDAIRDSFSGRDDMPSRALVQRIAMQVLASAKPVSVDAVMTEEQVKDAFYAAHCKTWYDCYPSAARDVAREILLAAKGDGHAD
jgi:hypothetical protein